MHVCKKTVNGQLVFLSIDGVEQSINPESEQKTRKPWPLVLLPLKLLAEPNDKGLGDIIARTIGPIGGDEFKAWYKATFGKDCSCDNRQEALNIRWPL